MLRQLKFRRTGFVMITVLLIVSSMTLVITAIANNTMQSKRLIIAQERKLQINQLFQQMEFEFEQLVLQAEFIALLDSQNDDEMYLSSETKVSFSQQLNCNLINDEQKNSKNTSSWQQLLFPDIDSEFTYGSYFSLLTDKQTENEQSYYLLIKIDCVKTEQTEFWQQQHHVYQLWLDPTYVTKR